MVCIRDPEPSRTRISVHIDDTGVQKAEHHGRPDLMRNSIIVLEEGDLVTRGHHRRDGHLCFLLRHHDRKPCGWGVASVGRNRRRVTVPRDSVSDLHHLTLRTTRKRKIPCCRGGAVPLTTGGMDAIGICLRRETPSLGAIRMMRGLGTARTAAEIETCPTAPKENMTHPDLVVTHLPRTDPMTSSCPSPPRDTKESNSKNTHSMIRVVPAGVTITSILPRAKAMLTGSTSAPKNRHRQMSGEAATVGAAALGIEVAAAVAPIVPGPPVTQVLAVLGLRDGTVHLVFLGKESHYMTERRIMNQCIVLRCFPLDIFESGYPFNSSVT